MFLIRHIFKSNFMHMKSAINTTGAKAASGATNPAIHFTQNLYSEIHDFAEGRPGPGPDVPNSNEISGIEVRLSRVVIHDNKTARVWPFPGLAQMYFMCIVLSDAAKKPVTIDLKGFQKVNDGDALHIDRTLFYWKKNKADRREEVPSQVHLFICMLKSKEALRDTGRMLKAISSDKSFKSASSEAKKLLKKSGDAAAITGMLFNLAGAAGRWLGEVDDKPLFAWAQSFTDINGDFDVLGKTDKQASNKYVSMALSVIIRDASRKAVAGEK
jgi:hypothetical protein